MNNKKTSQLVFDMKLVRKLLKMNGDIRFCPFCGKPIEENCTCHKNLVVDVKHKRETENETIAVFDNNDAFKTDYVKLIEEAKTKKESEDPEQISIDFN